MASARIFQAVVLLVLSSAAGMAQENRYMIFFKDKQGVSQTIEEPIRFLSEKAIQRRLEQNIDITEQDLPVSQIYVKGVRDAGANPYFTTRWLNGVLVSCAPSVVPGVEALSYVERVEYVAPPARESSGGRSAVNLRRKNNNIGVETETQLKMIGLDRMHQEDIKGKGITIAILDSGFPGVNDGPAFRHIFDDGRFIEEVSYDFVHDSPDVFSFDDHGTEVLSVIAGQIPDAFTGGAYEATFQLYVTEDVPTEYRIEEYNWLFAAERADSAGADIIHSSLGYYDFDDTSMNYSLRQMDGKSAVSTLAAQWAADRGIVVVVSAGNEGNIPSWRIISAPADAVDVIAVGAVNNEQQKTGSSSIGPTADNRIKPDLVALGMGVRVIRATGQISAVSGTSLSAPLVTSLAAGVMEYYPELGSKDIVDLLKQTASQAAAPDNLLGYGVPNFQAVINYREQSVQTNPFEVYPNPLKGHDTLTISPQDPEKFQACDIEVVSSQGLVLARQTAHFNWLNRTYKANLVPFPPGTYYIRVMSEKRRYTFKVVKL
ncbi:MAG: S8 family peptidase [Bacteroidota bacterium]|nr:S8 family peptidase [Bacteroidota bacterium]